ncbi:hypothetical protein PUNSTDRAFT_118024 [Punctularia strigosozonata HHB-11173 SS5]|uniref:uncharacterized protein n=1 Tax=Punctularia strigosozonata (strain HHB-11173) TaxID=741275 RepID=UPI0004418293|nr:uncharacterized protein PUNSTDRAFT_118024 [Punctularia strigosozonata HHB-11173 SS5]EIN14563.1 hypothetical protein PUNSTDRAFT_118024 [Punctularia strigosozonata HHB-11173 SS5]
MRVTRRTPDKMAKRTTSKRRYHTTRSVIDESYSDNVDSGTTAPVSGLGSHLATPFAPKNAVKIPYPQRAPGVVDRAEGEQRCTSAPEVASQRANSIRSSPHHTPPRQTGRTFQDEEYGLYASDTSPSDPKFSHTFSVLSISSPSNSPLGARDVIELSD